MAHRNACFPEERPAAKLVKPDQKPNNVNRYYNLGCQFRGKNHQAEYCKNSKLSDFAHKEISSNKSTTNASSSVLDKLSTSIDFVNNSTGHNREESNNSTSEKKDSPLLSSYNFGDDLDEQFIEELCRYRENSSEGWTSYYKLLNNLVENSLRENSTSLNCENQFSYVHSKGKKRKDFSGLDDFDEVNGGSDAVFNRSTTSEQITVEDIPNISSGVQSVEQTDSDTRTITNAAKGMFI